MTDKNDDAMAQAWRENNRDGDKQPPAQAAPAQPPAADDYVGAWNHHSPLDDGPSLDHASENWKDFRHAHPVAAIVADVAPIVGTVTGAADLNDAYKRGSKTGMATAVLGMVPSAGLIAKGAQAVRAGHAIQQAARTTQMSASAAAAARQAGDALKKTGATKAAVGVGAGTTTAGSTLADFADAWNKDAQ